MMKGILQRILLSLIGIMLILWGIGRIVLGIAGERGTAVITSIRRQGGERSDGIPGRYTYSIGYNLTLPDGSQIDGFTTKIADALYLKGDGSATIPVRYINEAPYINAPEEETRVSVGLLLIVAAGTFLIVVINASGKH